MNMIQMSGPRVPATSTDIGGRSNSTPSAAIRGYEARLSLPVEEAHLEGLVGQPDADALGLDVEWSTDEGPNGGR